MLTKTNAIEDPRAGAGPALTLVSHHLCPYVQRAAVALDEKGVAFERVSIDLADKPDWFRAISPLGKVPLLKVAGPQPETVLFESAAILEYLEETQPLPLHPTDPLKRARHRAWIEVGSTILAGIARFYVARDRLGLEAEAGRLASLFGRVESELAKGPWFAGERFSLVDAAFGPVFRYFDAFDRVADFGILAGKPRTEVWRRQLAQRPSLRRAVAPDYPDRLWAFLIARDSALSARMAD